METQAWGSTQTQWPHTSLKMEPSVTAPGYCQSCTEEANHQTGQLGSSMPGSWPVCCNYIIRRPPISEANPEAATPDKDRCAFVRNRGGGPAWSLLKHWENMDTLAPADAEKGGACAEDVVELGIAEGPGAAISI